MDYFWLSILFFLSFFFIKYSNRKNNKLPKEYSIQKIDNNYEISHNIRNGYSKRKIPKDIDTIIIGSGMSALTCAGLLSKVGKRVLVLEQHYIAGGCTHTYEDKGFEFDTGLHYIGNIKKRAAILDLITEPKINWDKIGTEENGYTYDILKINNKNIHLRAGRQAFLDEIEKYFPDEIKNVEKYLDHVKSVADSSLFFYLKIFRYPRLASIVNFLFNQSFFKSTRESAYEVISRFTKNQELIAVLCGQFGGYGSSPTKESFFIHASYVNHYMNGAWYPRGGCSVIAKNIIPIIEKTGGKVLVRKKVKQILLENNKAIGVEMINGDKIYSKNVVSASGVRNTWLNLIKSNSTPPQIYKNIQKMSPSSSMYYLTVGFDKSPEELNLPSSNMWVTPDIHFDEMLSKTKHNLLESDFPMFIGFPCVKDSTWSERFPGKSTAVVILMSDYSDFKKWTDNPFNKRSRDYTEYKNRISEYILTKGLFKHFPHLEQHLSYVKLGTPLTFNHFIGSMEGECYGMDNNNIRFQCNDWLRPNTPIENLFITGQDMMTMGVTGALMGGVITAHSILGYGTLADMIQDRNLIQDLINIKK